MRKVVLAGEAVTPDEYYIAQGLLQEVGAPTRMASLGLGAEEVSTALRYTHRLRNRFAVLKLERRLPS